MQTPPIAEQSPAAEHSPAADHREPTRGEAALFHLKSRVYIALRWLREFGKGPAAHAMGDVLAGAPLAGEAKTALWTQVSAAEFPLTAGKVQNLRAACRRLDGIEIPAGEVFSFWKQLGRVRRAEGFTEGRELRSGCLVPNLGGGLCQLSGLLHAAALETGLEVVERHEHSRTLPGSTLPPEQDATVFWNYVDLRFRAPFAWRLEARLSASHLVVSIRAKEGQATAKAKAPLVSSGSPVRASADGDCLTCGVTTCFRHPSAVQAHGPAGGHTAWLLEGRWPEFDTWCAGHSHAGDHWLTPLDGQRWKKPNYAWTIPPNVTLHRATLETLLRSWRQRRIPAQGAARQKFLLEGQARLAEGYARRLDPKARHLVICQTLLPHLWRAGHLGGRTFDVLVNRWPLAELHSRLDAAAARHPESDTLADFRADPGLVEAEMQALAGAARLITPHREIAAHFGGRALLLEWHQPAPFEKASPSASPRWFFPASALGRKGIHEVAEAVAQTGGELLILGRAKEGRGNPLEKIPHRQATLDELAACTALVLPAWIEHEPRLALRALASGIPVIASTACGLSRHPLLTRIDAGDAEALAKAMGELLAKEAPQTSPASSGAVA